MAKPRVISLFSGAGGLDYGLEAAGFETAVAVEMDHTACETLRANRSWRVIEKDLLQVSSDELLDVGDLKQGEAALLVGGPPCQPFSKAGYWMRGDALRLEDPRSNTLGAYLRVLEDTLPEAFLLENVEGLAYKNKDEGLSLLLRAIEGINKRRGTKYTYELKVLNAADYGVPQLRKRLLIVGARDGAKFVFPDATHGDDQEAIAEGRLLRRTTAWDALADVKPFAHEKLEMQGKWADLLPSIPEGNNYLWHTDRMGGVPLFGWRRRYWSFLLKLAKAQPSWTIQAQPGPAIGPFHWDNRRLSTREICRLQTFPNEVRIVGGRGAVQKQVGNAVPSLLAEVLGRSIRTQLLGLRKPQGGLHLLPPSRRVPEPQSVGVVPKQYLAMSGKHEAHRGPGTGPGALQRSLGA